MPDRIPIQTAKEIAHKHDYDQVIILARRIGVPGLEWVTTYGKNKVQCDAAAKIGDALRDNVVPTLNALENGLEKAINLLWEHCEGIAPRIEELENILNSTSKKRDV